MRVLKKNNPEAYVLFLKHITDQPKYKYLLLRSLFAFSRFSPLHSIPVLGPLLKSVQSLFFGYVTEIQETGESNSSMSDLNFIEMKFSDRELFEDVFDYIVIGSGPGAAIAAKKLKSSGRILILEQGDMPKTNHSRHHTLEHVTNDFYKSGQEIVVSPWMPQFAQGSVFGGGSEVNSGLYHELPEKIVAAFASAAGISESHYLASEREIRNLLQVSTMDVKSDDSLIARNASRLGLEFRNIPRWRSYSSKNSFVQNGMNEVVWNELNTLENFTFKRNVKVNYIDNTNSNYIVVFYKEKATGKINTAVCKELVVAAGATQSPFLLCKSGIVSWNSTQFQWHPMIRATVAAKSTDLGRYDIDPFQAWSPNKEYKFGAAVSTPGLLSMNLGRVLDHNEIPYLRSVYVSFISSGRGGLIPKTETPWYLPNYEDKQMLGGAIELLSEFMNSGDVKFANPKEKIKKGLSTVHIFGTLPINSEIYISGTLRLQIDPRIQVCDGSILPFGPGVNPQAVIMSLCDSLFGI